MKTTSVAVFAVVLGSLWVAPLRADIETIKITDVPGAAPTWIDGMLGGHHSLTATHTSLDYLILSGNNTFDAITSGAFSNSVILTDGGGTPDAYASFVAQAVDCSPVTFCNEQFTLTFESYTSPTFLAHLASLPGTISHTLDTGTQQDLASFLGTVGNPPQSQEVLGILVTGPQPTPEPSSIILLGTAFAVVARYLRRRPMGRS